MFPVSPCLLADSQTTPTVHRIWDERRRILELAFISDEHRSLACWPDFYRQYWASLRKLLQSPLYTDCQYRIGESAWSMTHELPVIVETGVSQLLEFGMQDEEVSSLARINEAFMQAMTGLVLDITFARIGCDGGTHVQTAAPERGATRGTKKRKTSSRTRAA
jgi:hypothetical protein